jgi:hypothetical protein
MKIINLKSIVGTLMLSAIVGMSANTFAKEIKFSKNTNCPTLTEDDVKFVIQNGYIEPEQIDQNTYFHLGAVKNVKKATYLVTINSILAANEADARAKANTIIFAPEKEFSVLPQSKSYCFYKQVQVSENETVIMGAMKVNKKEQDEIKQFPTIPSTPSTTATPF